jgi:hypothetical protein
LFGRQRHHLFAFDAWGLDRIGGVAGEYLMLNGTAKRQLADPVDVKAGCRAGSSS